MAELSSHNRHQRALQSLKYLLYCSFAEKSCQCLVLIKMYQVNRMEGNVRKGGKKKIDGERQRQELIDFACAHVNPLLVQLFIPFTQIWHTCYSQ